MRNSRQSVLPELRWPARIGPGGVCRPSPSNATKRRRAGLTRTQPSRGISRQRMPRRTQWLRLYQKRPQQRPRSSVPFSAAAKRPEELTPLVCADQFALGNGVLGGFVLDVHDFGSRSDVQFVDVEREQLEVIMMRPVALGRAGTAVTRLPEIVAHLCPDLLTSTDRSCRSR